MASQLPSSQPWTRYPPPSRAPPPCLEGAPQVEAGHAQLAGQRLCCCGILPRHLVGALRHLQLHAVRLAQREGEGEGSTGDRGVGHASAVRAARGPGGQTACTAARLPACMPWPPQAPHTPRARAHPPTCRSLRHLPTPSSLPTFCTCTMRSGSEMGGGVIRMIAGTPSDRRWPTMARRLALYSSSGTCCRALRGKGRQGKQRGSGRGSRLRGGAACCIVCCRTGRTAVAAWRGCIQLSTALPQPPPTAAQPRAAHAHSRAAVWQGGVVGAEEDGDEARRRRGCVGREHAVHQVHRPAGVVAAVACRGEAGGRGRGLGACVRHGKRTRRAAGPGRGGRGSSSTHVAAAAAQGQASCNGASTTKTCLGSRRRRAAGRRLPAGRSSRAQSRAA